jgi:hypothetical protein
MVSLSNYDSTADTLKHIKRVSQLLSQFATELLERGVCHDASKLHSPEKEGFDEFTPRLAGTTYGSIEYRECLAKLKPALDHHYAHNSHHPEYYENGIDGMTLVDLVEMLIDWKAASERHSDGDIYRRIEINTNRFNISPQLKVILVNTVNEFL